jgi:hypothetical protein
MHIWFSRIALGCTHLALDAVSTANAFAGISAECDSFLFPNAVERF